MSTRSSEAVKIAAAYIRVSTEEQAEQSPETQLIEIRKYAQRQGFVLPDDYVYIDEGISGKRSANRPAFMRMIGAAKEKPSPFDTILLWKFSRFARNQEESIVYKALLRKQCGVDVVSVSEPLPGGMFSSLIERIIEWFDEFYSIRLSQEVKRTMSVKAGRGEFQSSPPFGYRARQEQGRKTILEPVPEEARIVNEIFSRFLAGEGAYSIARWINSLGIKTHRGNPFENRTVEYILRNPVYIGKLRWTPSGRTRRDFKNPDTIIADASHEPIVQTEAWEAAQKKLDLLKATHPYRSRPSYMLKDWLSGIVYCAGCGTTLIFQKPHYMVCNNFVKGRCRTSQHVPVKVLHEAVLTRLKKDMADVGSIRYTVQKSAEGREELAGLEAALSDLKRRQSRLLEAYLSGAVELAAYKEMNDTLTNSVSSLNDRIASLNHVGDDNASDALAEQIRKTVETLESGASVEKKNAALRNIVERIVFDKAAQTLDITYRIFLI